MTTGKRIEAARREAGLSQAKLGARIGVTNHCISMWERDLRKPKYETLVRIAGALDVPVSKLMGGNMFSPSEDIVRVVRCPDCKYTSKGHFEIFEWVYCGKWKVEVKKGDYCSHGVRRGE